MNIDHEKHSITLRATKEPMMRPWMIMIATLVTFHLFLSGLALGAETTHHHKSHAHKSLDAHVHGEAKLNIVLNKTEGIIELESPADSVYGFEHQPKDAKQKQIVTDLNAKIKAFAAKLVIFSPVLKCQPQVEIETPFAKKSSHESEHADVEIKLKYKCPQNLETYSLLVEVRKYLPGIKKIHTTVVNSKKQYVVDITTASHKLAP